MMFHNKHQTQSQHCYSTIYRNTAFCDYYYYYYHHHHYHHRHLLYAGYLYLCSWDKLCPYGIQYCNYSVVTIHGAYIVSSSVESIVFYINIFRIICAVPNMAVFCSSLTLCFPGMLLTYFLNDFEIVPVAPIITGITFVFTFHMRCISIVRSLYFRIL